MVAMTSRRHTVRWTAWPGCTLAWRVAAVTAAVLIGGCAGDPSNALEHKAMPDFTDFTSLERPSSPNSWLIAPATVRKVAVDREAPVYRLPAEQLSKSWHEIVEAQPRTRILGVSDDGLQIEAEQRSALFGFVDLISFRAMPVDADSTTLFAYSRSLVGYWDVGVNRRRLTAWLDALDRCSHRR